MIKFRYNLKKLEVILLYFELKQEGVMYKKTLLILFALLLTSVVYSAPEEDNKLARERLQYGKEYIVTGKINDVSGMGELTVKPDIIITNFELMTEADTLEKASEENAKSMNELKNYLLSIGVKESDIETARYT